MVDKDLRELVVETPWQRRWLLVGLGLAMTVLCLWLVLQSRIGPLRYGGVPGLLFFPICLLYAVHRAVSPRPAVVFSAEGFTDHASALAVGFVPWNQVANISIVAVAGQDFVAVKLREPTLIIDGLRRWKRIGIAMSQRLWPGDVFIPTTVLPATASEFVATMEAWRRNRRA